MRYSFCAIALLVSLAVGVFAAGPTQQPKTRTVRYDKWGFAVEVPLTAVKRAGATDQSVLVNDIYVFGETVFAVKVATTPSDTLASTAIEKALQYYAAASGGQANSTRWELTLPNDVLAKGISAPLPPEQNAPGAEYVVKALHGAPAYMSISMMPVGGDTSPVLTLSVTGSKNRSTEIESLAKFMAFGVSWPGEKPQEPTATPPEPEVKPVIPEPKPVVPVRPKPVPAPKPAKLKKGDIEITGRVESIDADQHLLNVLVSRIRLPYMNPVSFDKPRRKPVFYKSLPEGVAVDSRVSIIGANSGVGNPMMADTIQAAP